MDLNLLNVSALAHFLNAAREQDRAAAARALEEASRGPHAL